MAAEHDSIRRHSAQVIVIWMKKATGVDIAELLVKERHRITRFTTQTPAPCMASIYGSSQLKMYQSLLWNINLLASMASWVFMLGSGPRFYQMFSSWCVLICNVQLVCKPQKNLSAPNTLEIVMQASICTNQWNEAYLGSDEDRLKQQYKRMK